MIAPVERKIEAVAIGASAGGVDALLGLMPAFRADAALAIFIVVHLGRQQPSQLAQVLDRTCALEVKEATDKELVRAGTVYVAPPDYHLLIDEGPSTSLSSDEPIHYSRPSIDVLLESAADVYGSALLGVILTGASGDGTDGLAAVQAAGGMTMVQRPETALSPTMAESALRRITPDFLVSLDEMGTIFKTLGRTELTHE